jgi:hypothetical protein
MIILVKVLKEHTVGKQEPFAAVLACADSRVPVELVFDQTIGHIFVTRVAGNIVTPEIIASLEYRFESEWRGKFPHLAEQRSASSRIFPFQDSFTMIPLNPPRLISYSCRVSGRDSKWPKTQYVALFHSVGQDLRRIGVVARNDARSGSSESKEWGGFQDSCF